MYINIYNYIYIILIGLSGIVPTFGFFQILTKPKACITPSSPNPNTNGRVLGLVTIYKGKCWSNAT